MHFYASLPAGLNSVNTAVGVLAAAKIHKGFFQQNNKQKKNDTTLSKRADTCGCFSNGLLLLMPAEYFWNRALETLLSRGQPD